MSVKRKDVSEEDGTSAAGIPIFGPVPPDPQHTINRLVSENTTLRTRLAEVDDRLKEAEWLIESAATSWNVEGWVNRRDAFLNPTNKDVM